jgi:phosphoserine phosphatase RsbU/P
MSEQLELLAPAPRLLPTSAGWQIIAQSQTAHEISGDFYGVFELPGDRLAFAIADVSHKSSSSVLFMSIIHHLLRTFSEVVRPDQEISDTEILRLVSQLNRYVVNHQQRYTWGATLFFGVLNPAAGLLRYINAGHETGLVMHLDGSRRLVPPTGPALGLKAYPGYQIIEARFGAGDTLFVYTDGVLNALNPQGETFGYDRLLTFVQSLSSTDFRKPGGLPELVAGELSNHLAGGRPNDDITMLALQRL